MFDAYTVKKVFPRLVVAAILIQLSWPLFTLMIEVVSQIAWGIEGLMYAPFGGREALNIGPLLGQAAGGGVDVTLVGLLGGVAATGAVIALGGLGLLSLGLTVLLALLIAFFVLAVRQVVLIVLLVIAPVALVAWILPNTEKLWKLWWESFSKLLFMYPLILLLIAGGRVAAKIAAEVSATSSANDGFGMAIVIVAFFGPFFLIPATFKLAGSAFANISGIVNDRGRGAFDRLRNYRGQKASENLQKAKNYQRYSDNTAFGRGLNKVIGAPMNYRDWKKGGIAAGVQRGRTNQGAEIFKTDPTMMANQNDDNFLLAVANEELAERKRAAAQQKFYQQQQAYNAAVASGDDDGAQSALEGMNGARAEYDARAASLASARTVANRNSSAVRMAAFQQLNSTGYQWSNGEAGYQEIVDTADQITGGDMGARASALNEAQFRLKGAGRLEFAGINHGAQLDIKTGVRKLSSYQRGQSKPDTYHSAAEGWLGGGVTGVKADADKPETIGNFREGIEQSLAAGTTTSADIADYHQLLMGDYGSATEANKKVIKAQLDAIESVRPGVSTGADDLATRLARNREEQRRFSIPDAERDENKPE